MASIMRLFVFTSLLLILAACSTTTATLPAPTPIVDRLAAPKVGDPPTQADRGALVYWQVCMACHGDRGQGLTDEWRAAWQDENGDDSNCWASGCHGYDHPPEGFSFPRTCCPAVLGEGTLIRFENAHELHQYLVDTMPWWNPGYLEEEEYWELTAFLMREHGALPKNVTLGEDNAAAFPLRLASPPPEDPRPIALLLSAILALAAGVMALQGKLRQ